MGGSLNSAGEETLELSRPEDRGVSSRLFLFLKRSRVRVLRIPNNERFSRSINVQNRYVQTR